MRMKGFGALAGILVIIVIAIVFAYLAGWRIVFNPFTMNFELAHRPEGAFSWLSKWIGLG